MLGESKCHALLSDLVSEDHVDEDLVLQFGRPGSVGGVDHHVRNRGTLEKEGEGIEGIFGNVFDDTLHFRDFENRF